VHEWLVITTAGRAAVAAGVVALLVAAALAVAGNVAFAAAAAGCGAFAAALLAARERRVWSATGIVYASAAFLPPVALRADAALGFVAIVFLFGIVWATDICGYFVGRAIGGPKLWPAVSPKKTWSGAIGGALGAVAAALTVASIGLRTGYRANLFAIAGIALLLSAASQAGDLFESAVKRRFGVKDASHVIPGHGGVMDRLDGFLVAAAVAAMIGLARGGFGAPARGLLVW
jgi:phosphatidate cytidylyltransferase